MFNRAFLFFCVFVVGWLVIVSRRCSYIIIICTHHNFVAYVWFSQHNNNNATNAGSYNQTSTTAFDQRAKSAKQIWVQLSAPRFKKANKRFKIDTDIHNYADPPKVVFNFFDGTKVSSSSLHSCGVLRFALSGDGAERVFYSVCATALLMCSRLLTRFMTTLFSYFWFLLLLHSFIHSSKKLINPKAWSFGHQRWDGRRNIVQSSSKTERNGGVVRNEWQEYWWRIIIAVRKRTMLVATLVVAIPGTIHKSY